ncbi:MAG: dTDP-4-dehydrorhamnose reductase [bacterium]
MVRRGESEAILITGCSGLLGQKLAAQAAERYTVYGVGLRQRSPVQGLLRQYIQLDITDRQSVLEALQTIRPDWVINTAAMTDVDGCEREPQRAFEVNVEGLHHLADGCQQCGARLVQLSSDYVFNGQSGPYAEGDEPNPLNVYGRTKAESERLLQQGGAEYVVVRTAVLYGFAPVARSNFVSWVCSSLRRGEKIRVATDLYANPTLVDGLAKAILTAIGKGARGVFHMAGSEWLSRYDFALKLAHALGLDHTFILPTPAAELNLDAPRPLRSGLKTDKAREELGLTFLSVEDGLKAMAEQAKGCKSG